MKSGSGQRPLRGRYQENQPQEQRTPQRNQTFDSNGPNVRVRGSATQIFERYVALAREAAIGDDRVGAENFYQHAEHYFRRLFDFYGRVLRQVPTRDPSLAPLPQGVLDAA